MAKLKPAKGGKRKKRSIAGAIPCVVFVLSGMALLSLLFYAILRSAGT
jgi:hypothetical protein